MSDERDGLQARLDEELEKRRILEKVLEDFQQNLRVQAQFGNGGTDAAS